MVLGCGPLGLLHVIVSKALGARVIASDINEERLAKAKELGADDILNPDKVDMKEQVKKLTDYGADIVIAALGSTKVVEQSLPLVRNAGIFNIFGGSPRGETIQVDPRWLHYGEIVLTGTFASSPATFKKAFTFVKENRDSVLKVISGRCGLDGLLDAVESVKKGDALKTILMFD